MSQVTLTGNALRIHQRAADPSFGNSPRCIAVVKRCLGMFTPSDQGRRVLPLAGRTQLMSAIVASSPSPEQRACLFKAYAIFAQTMNYVHEEVEEALAAHDDAPLPDLAPPSLHHSATSARAHPHSPSSPPSSHGSQAHGRQLRARLHRSVGIPTSPSAPRSPSSDNPWVVGPGRDFSQTPLFRSLGLGSASPAPARSATAPVAFRTAPSGLSLTQLDDRAFLQRNFATLQAGVRQFKANNPSITTGNTFLARHPDLLTTTTPSADDCEDIGLLYQSIINKHHQIDVRTLGLLQEAEDALPFDSVHVGMDQDPSTAFEARPTLVAMPHSAHLAVHSPSLVLGGDDGHVAPPTPASVDDAEPADGSDAIPLLSDPLDQLQSGASAQPRILQLDSRNQVACLQRLSDNSFIRANHRALCAGIVQFADAESYAVQHLISTSRESHPHLFDGSPTRLSDDECGIIANCYKAIVSQLGQVDAQSFQLMQAPSHSSAPARSAPTPHRDIAALKNPTTRFLSNNYGEVHRSMQEIFRTRRSTTAFQKMKAKFTPFFSFSTQEFNLIEAAMHQNPRSISSEAKKLICKAYASYLEFVRAEQAETSSQYRTRLQQRHTETARRTATERTGFITSLKTMQESGRFTDAQISVMRVALAREANGRTRSAAFESMRSNLSSWITSRDKFQPLMRLLGQNEDGDFLVDEDLSVEDKKLICRAYRLYLRERPLSDSQDREDIARIKAAAPRRPEGRLQARRTARRDASDPESMFDVRPPRSSVLRPGMRLPRASTTATPRGPAQPDRRTLQRADSDEDLLGDDELQDAEPRINTAALQSYAAHTPLLRTARSSAAPARTVALPSHAATSQRRSSTARSSAAPARTVHQPSHAASSQRRPTRSAPSTHPAARQSSGTVARPPARTVARPSSTGVSSQPRRSATPTTRRAPMLRGNFAYLDGQRPRSQASHSHAPRGSGGRFSYLVDE